jgi:hypothetical protein
LPPPLPKKKVLPTHNPSFATFDFITKEYTDDLVEAEQTRALAAEEVIDRKIIGLVQEGQDRGTVRNALVSTDNSWRVTTAEVTIAGVDYVEGDALFVPSISSSEVNAIITIDSVDSFGGILEATISKPGDYNT